MRRIPGHSLARFLLYDSRAYRSALALRSGCEPLMDSPAILSQGLPLTQAAALLYADGRTTDAEHTLLQALESDAEASQAWEMLFDLHRTRGDWRAFALLAER